MPGPDARIITRSRTPVTRPDDRLGADHGPTPPRSLLKPADRGISGKIARSDSPRTRRADGGLRRPKRAPRGPNGDCRLSRNLGYLGGPVLGWPGFRSWVDGWPERHSAPGFCGGDKP